MTRRWIGLVAALALPVGLLVTAPAATAAMQPAAVSPEIVNGEPGVAGEFPYLAYVGAFPDYPYGYSCGGTFVSTTKVVTAAHCFYDENGDPINDVRVGPANGTAKPYGSTLIAASQVEVHRDYDSRTQENDIAVITLSRPATGVTPVEIPTLSQWRGLTEGGDAVRSAGWGTTYSGASSSPSNFRVADLTVIPDSVCGDYNGTYPVGSLTYYGLGSSFDAQRMLCAGGATSSGLPVDTCQGDSGGPLVSGSTLVGIVSWGVGCAGEDDGQPIDLTPGVYTRLGSYLEWLSARGIDASVPVTVPGAPTSAKATVAAPGRFSLTWTAPSDDGGAAITAYEIEESIDGAPWTYLGRTDTAETGIDITEVDPGASYRYRVAAVNSAGVSDYSQPSAPVTMPSEVLTTPGKVSGFSKGKFVKSGKTYKVAVKWKQPVELGGSEIIGYLARVGYGGRWGSWTELDSPSTVATRLYKGKRYTIQVQAINSQGPGPIASYSFKTPRK